MLLLRLGVSKNCCNARVVPLCQTAIYLRPCKFGNGLRSSCGVLPQQMYRCVRRNLAGDWRTLGCRAFDGTLRLSNFCCKPNKRIVLLVIMPRGTSTRGICELHHRPFPCLGCRGAKGGRVRSDRKTAANRLRAREAAMARWHPKLVKEKA